MDWSEDCIVEVQEVRREKNEIHKGNDTKKNSWDIGLSTPL